MKINLKESVFIFLLFISPLRNFAQTTWVDAVDKHGREVFMPADKYKWDWGQATFLNSLIHLYNSKSTSEKLLYLNYVKTILNQYLNDYRIFSLFETESDNLQQIDHKKINVDEFTLYKFFKESYEMSESQCIFFLLDPLTINKNLVKKILNYVKKRKKNPKRHNCLLDFFISLINSVFPSFMCP